VADVPVPGAELTLDAGRPSNDVETAIPAAVLGVLRTLWTAGHAAYVVGGCLRDILLGRPVTDWDLATAALPEDMLAIFPGAVYENAFGTVAIRPPGHVGEVVQITTFRSDHDYADFRRPHRVEFGTSLEPDLARRDFTVNAMAWGAEAGEAPRLVDPHGGQADVAARTLRAVGDPQVRFGEDALRMIRAVRFAATLGFTIDPETLAGMRARSELVRHLSGERIAAELEKLLDADRPSVGLRLMSDTDLLAPLWPELAAQQGVPQNKVPGEDLWDHTLRATDGATRKPGRIRVAALLHDLGKPATMADGRFVGHERVGAEMAGDILDRLRWPNAERDRVVHLIRHHMFGYEPTWSDAAVRRFIAKVGVDRLEDQFLLREADNIGSGREPEAGHLDELRARVAAQLAAGVALDLRGLAVDGTDLMAALGMPAGPDLGRLLEVLLERVIADPSSNTRDRLIAMAREWRSRQAPA
jgi:tRNA nucleotidyltransferase/poly(A) polymerase